MTDKIQKRIKEHYIKSLDEQMCNDTLETIRKCKYWIEHLIQENIIPHPESFTELLTELTRIPLTKNHPLNKYKTTWKQTLN